MSTLENTTTPRESGRAHGISPERKRRRPSGEPPPLPRPLRTTGKIMLVLAGLVILVWLLFIFVEGTGAWVARVDLAMLRFGTRFRTDTLTAIARTVDNVLVSDLTLRLLRWATILALLAFKRFRHLLVYLATLLAVGFITIGAAALIPRPRPVGIEILDHWQGGSHPSPAIAALTVTLLGILYTLVVPGRYRNYGKVVAGILISAAILSRFYLGVEHPSDAIFGLILAVTISIVAFRRMTPNDVFPVAYGGGRTAHLDIGGERGEAIKSALEEQLGVTVLSMKPFGLEGSGGSTPIRLQVAEEDGEAYLFAKLYAQSHLRADRWYKVGRTLLYGRLEDESSFNTVRRLVQYEDYLLRVMVAAGINAPRPYGFVVITPEREYLIVTDFVDGAKEILEAEVTDAVIDNAMQLVRQLWDAGVAHRDIKPSNLLVRGDEVHLIDVAFGEVRPSPWRQAVDLANMMLVLALRSDAERVYRIALRYFSPEDIAEAFAATHGVTMPSQSRSMLRKDRRSLLKEFRELAPPHAPISIQRWSARRVGLMFACLLGALVVLGLTLSNLRGALLVGDPKASQAALSAIARAPECGLVEDPLVLVSQSVPSASQVPCLEALPLGWGFGAVNVDDTSSRFFLYYDRLGTDQILATFKDSCDVSEATPVPSVVPIEGVRQVELVRSYANRYVGSRFYVFEGGCLEMEFDFRGGGRTTLAAEVWGSFGLVPRSEIDKDIEKHLLH
jgi:tRNA A-37 threonylcarbamoyl transferase component Bud32/membrane-associated phospholipid phosphatase